MRPPRICLGDLAEVITKGTTPKTLGFGYVASGIPFLRAENIADLVVRWDKDVLYIDNETDSALARSRILPNDVLISIAGTIGRVGVVPPDVPPLNCNQAVALIRLGPKVAPRYLAHWLSSADAQRQITRAQVTATISNLSLGEIARLAVPLPPIAEQHRILATLDQADAIRRKRHEALSLSDQLARSIFLDMFGDPVTNPKGWPVRPFDAAVLDSTSGNPKVQQRDYLPSGSVPIVDQGASLFGGWTNDRELVVNAPVPAVIFGDHTKILKWIDRPFVLGADGVKVFVPQEGVEAAYLFWACRLFRFPDVGYSRHFKFLKHWRIPVPPMPSQRRFRLIFDSINALSQSMARGAAVADEFFESLRSITFEEGLTRGTSA